MLVTTQGAGGGAAESAAQQMARVAAATGNASAMAAAASVESASSSASGVVAGGVQVRLKAVAPVRPGYRAREALIRMAGTEAVALAISTAGAAHTLPPTAAAAKPPEK